MVEGYGGDGWVVRKGRVQMGPGLYTVKGALGLVRALSGCLFCARLEASHGCSRPKTSVRLVHTADRPDTDSSDRSQRFFQNCQ